MGMHVEDRLAGSLAGVEDKAVILEALARRDILGSRQQTTGEHRIGIGEFTGIGVMGDRDHQYVHRRLRRDIAKGHEIISAQHDVSGDLSRDDAAEQAVTHLLILPWPAPSMTGSVT